MGWLRSIRVMGLAAVTALAVACGSDKGGPSDPTGTIAIAVSKTALVATQGGSDNLTATITRAGGFTGDVNIVTEGAPTGVTAAASNVTTSGTTTTGTITVTVGAAVVPGTYNLTVRATGSGVAAVTQALTLTVNATPAIALALAAGTANIAAGGQTTVNTTLTRTNFTGAVTFTVEGAPTGVVATFAPNETTTSASVLTLQVGGAVAAGTYNLTVRASATGVTAATQPLALTVTAVASSYALSAEPPNATAQGGQTTSTITVTRTNFAGTVTLTLSGAPTGVTGIFTPSEVVGSNSTLTLTIGAAVEPGNYNLTVKGNATGQPEKTAAITLTVDLATPSGGYTLSATPTALTAQVGGAAQTATINIARTGTFEGPVTLAVTGQTAGLTATVAPGSTTGNTATLTVQAAGGTATGQVQLTVTGTANGLANQTTSVNVTVSPASQGGGNVTLNYAGCDALPAWVAYQDGTAGTWTRVLPNGSSFNFNITQGKGGIAIVNDEGTGLSLQFYTQAELTAFPGTFCPTSNVGKNILATAQNLSAGQAASLSLGGGAGFAVNLLPNATIAGVRDGTFDLFGYARTGLAVAASDRILIRRDINTAAIPAGGSIGNLDFTGAESSTPDPGAITLAGYAGEAVTASMSIGTGSACTIGSLYATVVGNSGTFTAYGIPAAKLRGTDYHNLTVIAAQGTTSSRTVSKIFQAMSAQTVTLPSVLPTATPTVLAGPYKRLRFQFTLPADLTTQATALYTDLANSVVISLSGGYIGGTALDVALPDFTAVNGWQNSWAPASGSSVTWSATAADVQIESFCTAATFRSASRTGTI